MTGEEPELDIDGDCVSNDELAVYLQATREISASLKRWSVEGPPARMRALMAEYSARLESISSDSCCQRIVAMRKYADSSDRQVAQLKAALMAEAEKRQADVAAGEAAVAAASASQAQLKLECNELAREVSALTRQAEAAEQDAAQRKQREALLASHLASVLSPVSVMCRIRPLASYPQAGAGAAERGPRANAGALAIDGGDLTIEDSGGRPRKFRVDRVLDGTATQDDVCSASAPWIENVVLGGSSCVLAYGATGSGKTHTLQGCPTSDGGPLGLAHHALRRLISECSARRPANVAASGGDEAAGSNGGDREDGKAGEFFSVRVSMVEVYCDQIRDLLGERDGTAEPPVLSSRRDAQGHIQLDCVEVPVRDFGAAQEALARGYSNRAAEATLCNERSSRSHVVITAHLPRRSVGGNSHGARGRLVLVDLAGSENVQRSGADAGGKLLDEAKAINRSLSALADVVEATAKRHNFVPYRNSRLTTLLEETLTSSKILLLVHVSPLVRDATNTVHSLQFAGRLQATDFGAQQLRKDQEERLRAGHARAEKENASLKAQVDMLRKELALAQAEKQELKQQVSLTANQLREKERELTREQELRARAESAREQRFAGGGGPDPQSQLAAASPASRLRESRPMGGSGSHSGSADRVGFAATPGRSRSPHWQGIRRSASSGAVSATALRPGASGTLATPRSSHSVGADSPAASRVAAIIVASPAPTPNASGAIVAERIGKKGSESYVRGPRVPLGELTSNCREDDKQVLSASRSATPPAPLGGKLRQPAPSPSIKPAQVAIAKDDGDGCDGPCGGGDREVAAPAEPASTPTRRLDSSLAASAWAATGGPNSGHSPVRSTQTCSALRISPAQGRESPLRLATPRSPPAGTSTAVPRSPTRSSPSSASVAPRSPLDGGATAGALRSPGSRQQHSPGAVPPRAEGTVDGVRFNLYDGVPVRSAIRRQPSDFREQMFERAKLAMEGKTVDDSRPGPTRHVAFAEETPVPKTPPKWYMDLMAERHLELLAAQAVAAANAEQAPTSIPAPAPPRSWISRQQTSSVVGSAGGGCASTRLKSPPPEGASGNAYSHHRGPIATVTAVAPPSVSELPRWRN